MKRMVQYLSFVLQILNYLKNRGIGPDWYDFMYSTNTFWDVDKRLLIPFYWKGNIVGFTGRIFESKYRFGFQN